MNKSIILAMVMAAVAVTMIVSATIATDQAFASSHGHGHERACQNGGAAKHNPHCNGDGETGGGTGDGSGGGGTGDNNPGGA